MLVKVTPLVNFTNILFAHLRQYPFATRSLNLKCKYKKAKLLYKKGARKMLVKLTPCRSLSKVE
jgi:hypothetical protein